MTRRILLLQLAALLPASAAWQPRPKRVPRYDPATEGEFHGTVEEVTGGGAEATGGVHLRFKTADGEVDVRVGPAAFLRRKDFVIVKGDSLHVTGSKVQIGGKEAVIARTIGKNGKSLTLRDRNGVPEWQRGRRTRKTS